MSLILYREFNSHDCTSTLFSVQVYMISLVRRPKRRNRMIACLEELNFDYTLFDAVDGR